MASGSRKGEKYKRGPERKRDVTKKVRPAIRGTPGWKASKNQRGKARHTWEKKGHLHRARFLTKGVKPGGPKTQGGQKKKKNQHLHKDAVAEE